SARFAQFDQCDFDCFATDTPTGSRIAPTSSCPAANTLSPFNASAKCGTGFAGATCAKSAISPRNQCGSCGLAGRERNDFSSPLNFSPKTLTLYDLSPPRLLPPC